MIREILKNSPLFAGLSAAALGDLTKASRKCAFASGEMIFSEGDEAEALFILAGGTVDLIKSSSAGKEQLVRSVKRGEIFAEAAMFSGDTYPVTAIARAPSELVSITKAAFVRFLKTHPDASMAIIGTMAKLLRHLNNLLSELSLSSVESRLAAWLLRRMREKGSRSFLIGIAKRDLAFRLGTVPETLSRNLRKLAQSGAIRVAGEKVTIVDADLLEESAGL